MNVLIVHAHPEPISFKASLTRIAAQCLTARGHEVVVSGLYADDFNARLSRRDMIGMADPNQFNPLAEQRLANIEWAFAPIVAREQARLVTTDVVVCQFPLWWFDMPAILKGWFDRVVAAGFAYGGGRWFETLVGRRALLSITMGAKADRWGDDKLFGSLDWTLHPIQVGTLNFCGFEVLRLHIHHGSASAEETGRVAMIEAWRNRLAHIDDERPLSMRKVADDADSAYRG